MRYAGVVLVAVIERAAVQSDDVGVNACISVGGRADVVVGSAWSVSRLRRQIQRAMSCSTPAMRYAGVVRQARAGGCASNKLTASDNVLGASFA